MESVIIVGAGPAGLATAQQLCAKGIMPLILEGGPCAGHSWASAQHKNLRLHTIRQFSALPGLSIPKRAGQLVSATDFANYLLQYAEQLPVKVKTDVSVTSIDRDGDGWLVKTNDAVYQSRSVVVATGFNRRAFTPDWPGVSDFTGTMLHSSEYVDINSLAGNNIVVVGCGNSGAEIAAELSSDPLLTVSLSVRSGPNIMPLKVLGVPVQVLGVAFGWMPSLVLNSFMILMQNVFLGSLSQFGLPKPHTGPIAQILEDRRAPVIDVGFVKQVRDRKLSVVPSVEKFSRDGVVLSDGAVIPADTVIAATGYRAQLNDFLPRELDVDAMGVPVLDENSQAANAQGLYFPGYFSSVRGVLFDIGQQAKKNAQVIAKSLKK